jgi:hypothetical protein
MRFRTAVNGFDDSLDSQKVLLVISDGEDAETDPLTAAQEAADAGVLIYTIGFGTPEGEPVPVLDAAGNVVDYKRNAQGEVVLSKLDETTLQEIARIGGRAILPRRRRCQRTGQPAGRTGHPAKSQIGKPLRHAHDRTLPGFPPGRPGSCWSSPN